MESFGGSGMVVVGNGVRKKRSEAARRPRHDSQSLLQSSHSTVEVEVNRDGMIGSSDGTRIMKKLKKLKLKVGGVTRTIHTAQEKTLLQDDIYGNESHNPSEKRKGFGVKFKNLSDPNPSSKTEQVRKSKRVPKRRVLDDGFSDEEDGDEKDDEIRFLERLKAPKNPCETEDGKEYKAKRERVILRVPKIREVMEVSYDENGRDFRKKSKPVKEFEDVDYMEEDEEEEDDECKSSKKKKKRGSPDLYPKERNDQSIPTTRNRSSSQSISASIELSELLSTHSNKKKEKLSDVEQQLKKAEAAQRRRIQSEKAAREAEAEAIRRILGQDSGRKKREEKIQKQRDERRQERAANSLTLAAKTVRWVNNPTGTIITFSEDIGLPTIFNHIPCSYPPSREKCAGPNCENAYKYRDSKSKLPLCSLQCYKAINQNVQVY